MLSRTLQQPAFETMSVSRAPIASLSAPNEQAERELTRARALDPADPAYAQALAIHYLQRGDLERARQEAEALVELTGGAPEARELLERIRQ